MEPGIHHNLAREEYDAIPAVNWSALSRGIGRTPEHIAVDLERQRKGDPNGDSTDSIARKFGRAVHTRVLEPEKFEAEWKIKEGVKTTKLPGHISETENAILRGIVNSLQRDLGDWATDQPTPYSLLYAPGGREVSVVWQTTPTGLFCKCRIDSIPKNGDLIADLKTTLDASGRSFERSIFRYAYHGQAAFALAGLSANGIHKRGMALVAIEKSRPYGWGIYIVEGDLLAAGETLYRSLLDGYARELKAGRWSSYGCHSVEVPAWLEERMDSEEISDTDLDGVDF